MGVEGKKKKIIILFEGVLFNSLKKIVEIKMHTFHSEILSPPNLGPSPRNWRIFIHFNVILTVFHIDHISQGACKTVRTTF